VDPAATTLIVLGAAVVTFVVNRLPVGAVAILTAFALYATGVLDADTALSGFGDPVVVFIAALFVVSEGIDSAGVTTWAGQALAQRTGTDARRGLVAVMLLVALLTALITPNGAVAALLPMVVVLAGRLATSPSQMLLPLAFAAHAGSLLALTGSPVNVIVADASRDAGGAGFGFVEYALVGVPLLLGTIALSVVLAPRVLPDAAPGTGGPPDLSRYADVLSAQYALDGGFYRLRVREASPLIGTHLDGAALEPYPGVGLVGVQTADREPVPPGRALAEDDVLVVTGPSEEVSHLVLDGLLAVSMRPLPVHDGGALLTREAGVVETVVPPRSPLLGEVFFPGMLRGSDLVVLAVRRRGKDLGPRGVALAEGDVLLLHGTWASIDTLVHDRDVLLVGSPDLIRRHGVPMGSKAPHALVIVAAMVVLLVVGVVPPAMAALLAATAMVLVRVVGVQQAYRSVSWQTVVLIGGLIPLSTAIRTSGAADLVAHALVSAIEGGGPYVLLLALFALTATLGQVVSNTATVLVVVPIAVAAAAETGVSVQPVLMLVAVAGAASFLTPIATPANMMVMGPGGYSFSSYWRLGLPLMALWLAVGLLVVPLVWPF
jgi:di/tricarboxylate transporter